MHAAVQCLLSVLFHTRIVDGHGVIPFVQMHPIPSLALLLLNGSQFGVEAAMQECVLGDKRLVEEIDVSGVHIDVRMVNYIHSERQKRIQFIVSRIEAWPGCELNESVAECLRGPWHMTLRKEVEDNPTLVALSKYVYQNRTCLYCGQDLTSTRQFNINFLFEELRSLEEFAIPLPSVSDLSTGHAFPIIDAVPVVHTLTPDHEADSSS